MRILIIDDEPLTAKFLKKLIEQNCYGVKSISIITNPEEALDKGLRSYDVLFLDIKMPQMNAFEFIAQAEPQKDLAIVFTTAHENYALDAFGVNAVDYLLKPVSPEQLIVAVNKAKRYLGKTSDKLGDKIQNDRIKIYDQNEYVLIKVDQLIRVEADGNYSKVITKEKEYTVSKKISYFEEQLESLPFLRCHKSHLVNLSQIEKIGKGKGSYLTLSNSDVVPLSNSKKVKLEQQLGIE